MFQRAWKDEPDNWKTITEHELRIALNRCYKDAQLVIDAMRQSPGHSFETMFSLVRYISLAGE